MEVPLFAAHRLPGRVTRRNELLQNPTISLGERAHSDSYQAAAAHHEEQSSVEDQDRSLLSSDREHRISTDDRALVPDAAGHDCSIQSRLVPDALYRSSLVARVDGFGVHVLSCFSTRALSRLEK